MSRPPTEKPERSREYFAYKALAIHPRLSARGRRLAGALIDHCNGTTDKCNPGLGTLALDTGIDQADVVHALKELYEGDDRLFDRIPGRRGRGHSASYAPRWDCFRAIVDTFEAGTRRNSAKPEKGGDATPISNSPEKVVAPGVKGGGTPPEKVAMPPHEPLRTQNRTLESRAREPHRSTRPFAHEGARPVGSALAEKVTTVNGVTVRYRPIAEDKAKGRREASARIDQALLADGVELYMAVQERLTVEQVEQAVDVEVAYPGRGNGARMQRVLAEGGRFHPTPVNNIADLLRAVPADWIAAMAKIWGVPVEAVETMLQAAIRHAATLPDDTTTLDIDAATLRAAPPSRSTLQ